MKPKARTLLLHPAFLFSLAVLLLNDLYLKYAFHNWLTGKLSDFAGLFVFVIFFIAVSPIHKKKIILGAALFFTWWKSSYSNSFIALLNETLALPVERTVDYTDLMALLVLPFASRMKEPAGVDSLMRSLAIKTSAILAFFSICATSLPRHLMYDYYEENSVSFYRTFSSAYSDQEILEKLDPEKRGYRKDSVKFYRIREGNNFYQRIQSQKDSTVLWSPVTNSDDSALFVKTTGSVYFTIPSYILLGDTINNLQLRFYHNTRKRKPTTVQLISFQINKVSRYGDLSWEDKWKLYTKHFKTLFKK